MEVVKTQLSDAELVKIREAAVPASFLRACMGLVGVCLVFGVLNELGIGLYDKYTFWLLGAPVLLLLFLTCLVWGVRRQTLWAWWGAMLFSVLLVPLFPVGTIIAYYLMTRLWADRGCFDRSTKVERGVQREMKVPSAEFLLLLWVLSIPFAVGGYAVVADKYVPSRVIRALPEGATDVTEYYSGASFTGDFERIMKARIAKNQVEAYAMRLGANSPVVGKMSLRKLGWLGKPTAGGQWWDPPKKPLFFHSEEGFRKLVGWKNGFVYVDVVMW
ncbi:MAG: hypothetical protein L3J39_09070 [Verrucomicrobiales bacterium]|nr:hypothetical protein [Verrucomicrobiales bacterium]